MIVDGYQTDILTNNGTTGISSSETINPPKMTYDPKMPGWVCPVCGRGLSPFTAACPCKNDESTIEYQWIPVTERMPEEDYEEGDGTQLSDYVLMTATNTDGTESFVDIGSTQDGTWWSATRGHDIHGGWAVTAWMPLPEPYRSKP